MTKIFHPLLAMIASAIESELARYAEYLKEENRILRARLAKQVQMRPHAMNILRFYRADFCADKIWLCTEHC